MDELEIYSKEILRLAQMARQTGEISPNLAYFSSQTSPLCGTRIDCGLEYDTNGIIRDLEIIARACNLGCASAALTQMIMIGKPLSQAAAAHDQVQRILQTPDAQPHKILSPEFAQYAIFAPCSAIRSRHAAILLPLKILKDIYYDPETFAR